MPTVEELLRKSLEERRAKPLQAVNDLKAVVAEVAAAVSSVTDDSVKVVLQPLKPKEGKGPSFALYVHIEDDSRLLRAFAFSEEGYPATLFNDLHSWDLGILFKAKLPTSQELREHVLNLLSGPQSELVRIIDNHLASLSPA
jgi:hypothetical protein